ncbi:MAG: CRP/FNR family cyclic AMP-dependent transcriptional regulator [Gammaproteobacteria bacterium]|jgi:CRP/FNR family cyclic AMP-dependent transcriptional regulator
MDNKRLQSASLSDALELIGEGPSFKNSLHDMLTNAMCFTRFSSQDINILVDHIKAYHVPARTTIFHEGERNSYLCVLIDGRIGVYKEDERGERKQLATIKQGKIFGEISLIDDFPYSASIVAETDVTCCLMSRENFRNCVDVNPILGVRLMRLISSMLCMRLRSTSGQLVDLIDT